MKRIDIRSEITNRKEKILYLVVLIGLAVLYVTYIPCLLDYYIIRPEQSYLSFFGDNYVKPLYTFECIVIGMALAALYCLTLRAGSSTLVVSVFLFILTHASYIKYINRRELLRLDDLRLTEAAGMALDYFRFELNRWLVLLAGILILFAGAGFALDWFRRRTRKGREAGHDAAQKARQRGHRRIMAFARLLGFVCLCAVIFLYANHVLEKRYVIDVIEPLVPETEQYVLYRFLQNDSLSAISVERVEESYDFLLSQEPAKEPVDREDYSNVIVIMNESWWNTDNIQSDRTENMKNDFKGLEINFSDDFKTCELRYTYLSDVVLFDSKNSNAAFSVSDFREASNSKDTCMKFSDGKIKVELLKTVPDSEMHIILEKLR